MYIVLQLNKKVSISVLDKETEIPLSYYAGMIGALPVFATREDAEKVAGDKCDICKIREVNNHEST